MTLVNIGSGQVTDPGPVLGKGFKAFPCLDSAFPVLARSVDTNLVGLWGVDATETDLCGSGVDRIRVDYPGNRLYLFGARGVKADKTAQTLKAARINVAPFGNRKPALIVNNLLHFPGEGYRSAISGAAGRQT